jgi:hypothetical protein
LIFPSKWCHGDLAMTYHFLVRDSHLKRPRVQFMALNKIALFHWALEWHLIWPLRGLTKKGEGSNRLGCWFTQALNFCRLVNTVDDLSSKKCY